MLVLYKKSGSNGIEFLNNPNVVEKYSSLSFYCSNFSPSAPSRGLTDCENALTSLLSKISGGVPLSYLTWSKVEEKLLKINLYFKELFLDVSSTYVLTENENTPYSVFRFPCNNFVFDGRNGTLAFQFSACFGNSTLSFVLTYNVGRDEWVDSFSSQDVFNEMRISCIGCSLLSS